MAVYGLQKNFINKILSEYFGLDIPDLASKELYAGLGLNQTGALINIPDFSEVFDGKPYGNYKRARVIFGKADNKQISNSNEIMFDTATEDWTLAGQTIDMIGIFDTVLYVDEDMNKIQPIVVLPLVQSETVVKGETLLLSKGALVLNLTDM